MLYYNISQKYLLFFFPNFCRPTIQLGAMCLQLGMTEPAYQVIPLKDGRFRATANLVNGLVQQGAAKPTREDAVESAATFMLRSLVCYFVFCNILLAVHNNEIFLA